MENNKPKLEMPKAVVHYLNRTNTSTSVLNDVLNEFGIVMSTIATVPMWELEKDIRKSVV
jgi:hypothetical protein